MLVLGKYFINDHCVVHTRTAKDRTETANCFATGEANRSYQQLETQYDELEWLLVDCGSTIHICRDIDKLHNLRQKKTTIKGIVGDASSVSEWVGDWNLVFKTSNGKYRNFTLRNVVCMPNASRDILGTPRLEKSGWWPDLRMKRMYNDSETSEHPMFPFFVTKKGLKVIPSVKIASNAHNSASVTLSRSTINTMNKVTTESVLHSDAVTKEPVTTEQQQFTYSIWYGGAGAFAHSTPQGKCKSYFDKDGNTQRYLRSVL